MFKYFFLITVDKPGLTWSANGTMLFLIRFLMYFGSVFEESSHHVKFFLRHQFLNSILGVERKGLMTFPRETGISLPSPCREEKIQVSTASSKWCPVTTGSGNCDKNLYLSFLQYSSQDSSESFSRVKVPTWSFRFLLPANSLTKFCAVSEFVVPWWKNANSNSLFPFWRKSVTATLSTPPEKATTHFLGSWPKNLIMWILKMVDRLGLEPRTIALWARCANLLRHRSIKLLSNLLIYCPVTSVMFNLHYLSPTLHNLFS